MLIISKITCEALITPKTSIIAKIFALDQSNLTLIFLHTSDEHCILWDCHVGNACRPDVQVHRQVSGLIVGHKRRADVHVCDARTGVGDVDTSDRTGRHRGLEEGQDKEAAPLRVFTFTANQF